MLDLWREQKAVIYGGFLIAIAIIISFVTVKLPPGRMVGGIGAATHMTNGLSRRWPLSQSAPVPT